MQNEQLMQINGWTIFIHPLLLEEIEMLKTKISQLKEKYPHDYQSKNATKRLSAILKLIKQIPENPEDPKYRLGTTLGYSNKHWFRAKFFQQYRLFFRFDTQAKIIIFVWVNDDDHKRAYGSKNDAYRTFQKMLKNGNPPDEWDELFSQSDSDISEVIKFTPST